MAGALAIFAAAGVEETVAVGATAVAVEGATVVGGATVAGAGVLAAGEADATVCTATEGAEEAATGFPGPEATSKIPSEWGPGSPSRGIGEGTRWSDPSAKPGTNYVRIDQGQPSHYNPLQQVDHVHISSGGAQIADHLPLDEWLTWSSWNVP